MTLTTLTQDSTVAQLIQAVDEAAKARKEKGVVAGAKLIVGFPVAKKDLVELARDTTLAEAGVDSGETLVLSNPAAAEQRLAAA